MRKTIITAITTLLTITTMLTGCNNSKPVSDVNDTEIVTTTESIEDTEADSEKTVETSDEETSADASNDTVDSDKDNTETTVSTEAANPVHTHNWVAVTETVTITDSPATTRQELIKEAWDETFEQSQITYSESKRWDGLVVDTEAWIVDNVVQFHYDGYIPISADDSKSHQLMLAEMLVDPSYSCPVISFPNSLTATEPELGDKNVREYTTRMTEFIVFNYDGYVPTSFEDFAAHQLALNNAGLDYSYHTEEIDIMTKTYIIHHDAVYKTVNVPAVTHTETRITGYKCSCGATK